MEENTKLLSIDSIRNRVYMIRGQQVMLDADLAEIYGYEVKRLNEQVKNNRSRFPEDFMFQLEKDEVPEVFLKSKNSTLNISRDKRGLHMKKMPYAFTEQAYHCGAYSKDAGKKVCAINKMEDSTLIHPVIEQLLCAQ